MKSETQTDDDMIVEILPNRPRAWLMSVLLIPLGIVTLMASTGAMLSLSFDRVPDHAIGVGLVSLGVSIACLVFWPWLLVRRVRNQNPRPLLRITKSHLEYYGPTTRKIPWKEIARLVPCWYGRYNTGFYVIDVAGINPPYLRDWLSRTNPIAQILPAAFLLDGARSSEETVEGLCRWIMDVHEDPTFPPPRFLRVRYPSQNAMSVKRSPIPRAHAVVTRNS